MLKALHKWLSLAVGLFWLLQVASGCILVFHRELDDALLGEPPAVAVGTSLNLDRVVAAARAVSPQLQVTRVMTSGGFGSQVDVIGLLPSGEDRVVRVDAVTGTVLRSSAWSTSLADTSLFRIVFLFHQQLLAGPAGHWAVGFTGALLGVSIVLGLNIAWPRRGTWRVVLRPKRFRTNLPSYYAWHRALGLWAAVPALLLVLSGVALVWIAPLQDLLRTTVHPPEPSTASKAEIITPQQAFKSGLAAFEGAGFSVLDMPTRPDGHYRIRLLQEPELRRAFGTTVVYVAAGDGSVAKEHDPLEAPLRYRLVDSIYAIHTGEIFGTGGRIASLSVSVALLLLMAVGTLMWLKKRKTKRSS